MHNMIDSEHCMDYYLLVATISLIFQIGVFVLLLEGYKLKKQKKFRLHGVFMLASVVLHIIAISVIMVPSFALGVIPLITTQAVDVKTVLAPLHASTGIAAAVLGVWIVASWRLRRSLEFCTPKKKWMRFTLAVWLTALLSGFLLYLSFYWTMMFG